MGESTAWIRCKCAWVPSLQRKWMDECTYQYIGMYLLILKYLFSTGNPGSNICKRGFKRMKINDARLHTTHLQNFRQNLALSCRAGLLHWNHSFLLCVYNIQHKWKTVKGFCEKNVKIFFRPAWQKTCNDGAGWRKFIWGFGGIRMSFGREQTLAQLIQKPP